MRFGCGRNCTRDDPGGQKPVGNDTKGKGAQGRPATVSTRLAASLIRIATRAPPVPGQNGVIYGAD